MGLLCVSDVSALRKPPQGSVWVIFFVLKKKKTMVCFHNSFHLMMKLFHGPIFNVLKIQSVVFLYL